MLRSVLPARSIATVVLALAWLGQTAGCGAGGYEVVRVHAGRARVGRFVSSAAYAASLDAAIAEERGDWPAAVEALRRARDEDPDGPELQARLGIALCRTGKHDAGRFAIDDALRIDPELERGWTGRAICRMASRGGVPRPTSWSANDDAAARADLARAMQADPDAIAPVLLLVELDLRAGALARARARVEEAVVLHPTSSRAWTALAEVAARQGDAKRAVSAARAASELDDAIGLEAKRAAFPAAARSGVAEWALALRDKAKPNGHATAPDVGSTSHPSTPGDAACEARLVAFRAIAAKAERDAIAIAADAVRAACPALEAPVTMIEVQATWTPANAEVVEAKALAAPSNETRRWGARMRLRRATLDELLVEDALPAAEDRATLALELAATALRKTTTAKPEAEALGRAAYDLAPAEPTVARMLAELARRLGHGPDDPWRKAACLLARTPFEIAACKGA